MFSLYRTHTVSKKFMESINNNVILNNGIKVPILGFGVFQVPDAEEVNNVVMMRL